MPDDLTKEVMPTGGREPSPPPVEKVLAPHEEVEIDLNAALAGEAELAEQAGIDGRLVATVSSSSKTFLIVDTRGKDADSDFYIVDETYSLENRKGYKGIHENVPVTIGRGHHANRFSYPDTVSRSHFEVVYENGELFIRNFDSPNNTVVTAHLLGKDGQTLPPIRPAIGADRTYQGEARVRHHPGFGEKDATAPYGYYMGRPILGRKSGSVDGGVYLGGSAREAIVVDGNSAALSRIYDDVEAGIQDSVEKNQTLPVRAILHTVMEKVREVMPYDGQKAEAFSRRYHGDQLINLSAYANEGMGVCRHQSLMGAYLLERLIRSGHMLGSVGIERNTAEDVGGSHAWIVYKTHETRDRDEDAVVIDPANSFLGSKAEAVREGHWEYRLPSDDY